MSDVSQTLVDTLIRLAQGDLEARMERTFARDEPDTLAFCVNMLAAEFERLLAEREQSVQRLEQAVRTLSESFEALGRGEYDARVPVKGGDEPTDVLAQQFNRTAVQVQRSVGALEEQRSVLEATLEAMLDPVLLLDPGGAITRANRAAGVLFGRAADALVGGAIREILTPDEASFADTFARSVAESAIRERDTGFVTSDGYVTFPINASAYRDGEEAVNGIVLVIRDDRDLRQARAQLQMTDRLAAMGTVAAGVAHEINNPLAFVMSNLEFLSEELTDERLATLGEDGAELAEALSAARRGSERVRQIVQDLRTFSRADRDSTRPIDVNQLIESTLSMLGNEVRHHAQVELELGAVPRVEANEAKLGQVFLNLVHNAAQAIAPGRVSENRIRIRSWTDEEGRAVVGVEDTGKGIEPAHLNRIFDAFFTTKPVGVGTGLGLSICHEVISKLDGTIEVKSTPGEGTTFTVRLPPSQRPELLDGGEPAPEPAARRRRRVLVIDDEAEVGLSVRRILRRRHDVDVVERAAAALALLASTPYDIILCDLMMPEMTGMEFYEHLARDRPALTDAVVFMTGGAFGAEARAFLQEARNPVVEKPFEARVLRELIEDVVSRG